MRTIEITSIEDVRDGDVVTVKLPALPLPTTVTGHVYIAQGAGIVLWDVPGVGEIDMDCWSFVSATREVPEWEPGMSGTATVSGVKDVEVVRALSTPGEALWFTPIPPTTPFGRIGHWHLDDQVTGFVPDNASRWAAQAKLVEADLDNARAEVERWKAEAEMLTAKVDRLMPLQEHENECAYRQRTEKAEAEVERLRAARTVPTRDQVAEILRARMGGNIEAWHDDADNILALIRVTRHDRV